MFTEGDAVNGVESVISRILLDTVRHTSHRQGRTKATQAQPNNFAKLTI